MICWKENSPSSPRLPHDGIAISRHTRGFQASAVPSTTKHTKPRFPPTEWFVQPDLVCLSIQPVKQHANQPKQRDHTGNRAPKAKQRRISDHHGEGSDHRSTPDSARIFLFVLPIGQRPPDLHNTFAGKKSVSKNRNLNLFRFRKIFRLYRQAALPPSRKVYFPETQRTPLKNNESGSP